MKRSSKVVALAVALTAVLFVVPVRGNTFFEGFEDGTLGAAPAGWFSVHNSNQQISNAFASEGDQSCRLETTAWAAGSRMQAFSASGVPFTFSFDIRYSSESSMIDGRDGQLYVDLIGPDYWLHAGMLSSGVSGGRDTRLFVAGGNGTVTVNADLDTWYQFLWEANPLTRTASFSYRILGQETMTNLLTDIPFLVSNDPVKEPANHIRFGSGGDEPVTVGYFDNISVVAVPEPTTLMLLGLGGIFLRKRKV